MDTKKSGEFVADYNRMEKEKTAGRTVHMAILFFIGTAVVGFAVLRTLAYCDRKRKSRNGADHMRR